VPASRLLSLTWLPAQKRSLPEPDHTAEITCSDREGSTPENVLSAHRAVRDVPPDIPCAAIGGDAPVSVRIASSALCRFCIANRPQTPEMREIQTARHADALNAEQPRLEPAGDAPWSQVAQRKSDVQENAHGMVTPMPSRKESSGPRDSSHPS